MIIYHHHILSLHFLSWRQLQKGNTLHYRPCPSIHRKMTDAADITTLLLVLFIRSCEVRNVQSVDIIHCYICSFSPAHVCSLNRISPNPGGRTGTSPGITVTLVSPPGLSYHTYSILVAYLVWLGVVERRCTFTHICNRRQSETCKALFDAG